jgi:hypothetical protein
MPCIMPYCPGLTFQILLMKIVSQKKVSALACSDRISV